MSCINLFVFQILKFDNELVCKQCASLVVGAAEKLEFQAETRKLLDIVAKSLYSEKEVST